ncbi:SPOR domain-containing protein [Palleronia sp. KMU-117]|uniref:SPOR domain-containing protein n=1 Tax=Palleronia sp. KMU-117 TaxID=3434108 RepID=UPI003D756A44
MADFTYDDAYGVDEAAQGASVTTFVNWAGAIVSLALLGGLGYWGWQLLVRDVSGVPVITALEGPMRVAPDNPGGEIADHQGLAVNRVAAVGEAAPGADSVVLAPSPAGLADEDAPMATLLPEATAAAGTAPATPADAAAADAPTPSGASVLAVDPTLNMSPTDLAVLAALAELEPDLIADPAPEADAEVAAGAVAASAGGMTMSPRPVPRPAARPAPASFAAMAPAELAPSAVSMSDDMGVAISPAVASATDLALDGAVTPVSTASSGIDVDPASVPVGTRLVQLGAFPTQAEAVAEWTRIDSAFGDYMDGKRRLIQQAETGGTTFYRLRAMGFADLSDARRFCAVLVAGEASCIPVVAR